MFTLEEFNSHLLSRRDLFRRSAAVLGAVALGSLGFSELASFSEYDPSNPLIDIVYHKIPGMTRRAFVIHLTDLHFGEDEAYVNAQVLDQIVRKINETIYQLGATPDSTALIMTGDWVSKKSNPNSTSVLRMVERLISKHSMSC